ncbi:MAG: BON domain-containing protein [Maricaulaceae bacterium]|nr:BON domain-containing protein [Maricaulaceae bacterium]
MIPHAVSRLAAAAALALTLSACAAVQQERSVGRSIDDANANIAIRAAMMRAEDHDLTGVRVDVSQGVALLAGTTPREEDRLMAECLAWSSVAVRTVQNEITVDGPPTFGDRSRDVWITQRVRGRLLRDRSVRLINFNVETFNGVVYLMGVARTRGELERAASHAGLVDGVERVVTYVRVLGEDEEPISRGERRAQICGAEPVAPPLDMPQDLRAAPVVPID